MQWLDKASKSLLGGATAVAVGCSTVWMCCLEKWWTDSTRTIVENIVSSSGHTTTLQYLYRIWKKLFFNNIIFENILKLFVFWLEGISKDIFIVYLYLKLIIP